MLLILVVVLLVLLVLVVLVVLVLVVLLLVLLLGPPWKAPGLTRRPRWQTRLRREQQGCRFPAHEARRKHRRPQLLIVLCPVLPTFSWTMRKPAQIDRVATAATVTAAGVMHEVPTRRDRPWRSYPSKSLKWGRARLSQSLLP